MTNLIVFIVLALIVGSAAAFIIREKKRGVKCVGCPHAKECSGKCGGHL